MSIYKKGLEQKLRFKTVRGFVSIEDLFDIPLKSNDKFNLNDIAKEIYRIVQNEVDVDFVDEGKSVDLIEELKLDIIKDIIKDKKEKIQKVEDEAIRKSFNENIDKLIAEKEKEELKNLSTEELRALRR